MFQKKKGKKREEDPISDIMVKVTGDHPEEGSFGVPPRKYLILVLPPPPVSVALLPALVPPSHASGTPPASAQHHGQHPDP